MIIVALDDLVNGTLGRLDDSSAEVYSRDEIKIYVKDGYDLLCRRAKPIFDIVYIENLPAVGNWSSEEEFELAKQIPGLILTGKRHFTREIDRALAPAGSVGPAALSTHAHIPLLSLIDPEPERANPVGQLPHNLVEIERVAHDQITIFPEFSTGLAREHDNRYETQGGDPDWFTVDKDGLFTLRRFPSGDGMAEYDTVQGHFGVEVSDSAFAGTIVGSWGAIAYDSEAFPSGSPWGAPTRTHPDVNNTRVEITRLGRDLDSYPVEVPSGYVKYIEFWACSRALKRDGPGQDLKLSEHYAKRFDKGVRRLKNRVNSVQSEHKGRIGHGTSNDVPSMSIRLPYNYGRQRRRSGRY